MNKNNNSLVDTYIQDIANRLKEPEVYGAVSLMVGAGFSKNATAIGSNTTMPDWNELAGVMYDELYPDNRDKDNYLQLKEVECSGKNVLTLAQKYEVIFGRSSLNKTIERVIDDECYKPSELHKELVSLGWNDIFTTNYDTLLERSISVSPTKRGYKIINSQNDLPGNIRPRLIKLHGTVGKPNDFIITEEDYRKYPSDFAPLVNTVQQSMLETRLCLVGFSGTDPNFLNWLGWLRDTMGDNCPVIYLCGVFDFDEAYSKMLEKRNIKVVDLSALIKDNVENRHYEAIKEFLRLLKKDKEKSEEFNIGVLLKDDSRGDKLTEVDYEKLEYKIEYMNKFFEKTICFPYNLENNIGTFFLNKLFKLLKQDESKRNLQMIGDCCRILKKCNCVLYDYIAEQLESVLENNKSDNTVKINVGLYLMQMYRIDGKYPEYEKVQERIKTILDKITVLEKNKLYIEFAKLYIARFDYTKAKHCILKIKADNYDEYTLKKISLMIQVGDIEDAKEMLNKTMALIAQQRLPKDKRAAYMGYMNMIARNARMYKLMTEYFSDKEYEYNMYNTRIIVEKARDYLLESIVLNDEKSEAESNGFTPNSYIMTRSFGKTAEDKKRESAFEYLLLLDNLCLDPPYGHSKTVEEAIAIIEDTTESPLWEWYCILKNNDSKQINRFFTRSRIYLTKKKYVEIFFDQIVNLIDDMLNENKQFNTMQITGLLEVASRLSIVLDEERIFELISILVKADKYEIFSESINKSLKKIKDSFNENIMKKCLGFIKGNRLEKYNFLSMFGGIKITNLSNEEANIIDEIVSSISQELEEEETRNIAVTKCVVFEDEIRDSEKFGEICDKLWKKFDDYGFPENEVYLPIVWKDYVGYDFDSKMKEYFCNPNITERANDSGVIIYGEDPYMEIQRYTSMLLKWVISNEKDVCLSQSDAIRVIQYFINYIEHEKTLLKERFDPFEDSDKTRVTLQSINNIILLLYMHLKQNNLLDDEIFSWFTDYENTMKTSHLSTAALEIVFLNSVADLEKRIGKCIRWIVSRNKYKVIEGVFALFVLRELLTEESDCKLVENKILYLIEVLKYCDIDISSRSIIHLNLLCKNSMFLNKDNRDHLATELIECYTNYVIFVKDKRESCINGMYNISRFLKEYIGYLNENGVEKGKNIIALIELLKESKLNEVRVDWVERLD